MNTKKLAAVIIFTAMSLAMEPIRIPILFWPGQYFRIIELPIIIAYFLFGFKAGFSVALLNAIGHITVFPDASGILAPPWRIIVMLSLFLGLELAAKAVNRNFNKNLPNENCKIKPVFYFTTFGILTRATIIPFVDYGMFRFVWPFVIGRALPDAYLLGLMPATVFFNILVPLCIVPLAYSIAGIIGKNMGIGNELTRSRVFPSYSID